MKIIANTPDGFITELSTVEASRLAGTTPKVGDVIDPIKLTNRLDWLEANVKKLAELNTQFRTVSDSLMALMQEQTNG